MRRWSFTPPKCRRSGPTGSRSRRRSDAAGAITTPIAVTIAGSDSSGGAGIQADLKTFSALGVYGASVITALTAQNTQGVTAIHPVPAEFVAAQIDAVFGDLAVGAVKIGMLGTVASIEAVVQALDELPDGTPIVLDPVMVSESGAELLERDARSALVTRLLPRVTVVTPNVPEARALLQTARARGRSRADLSTPDPTQRDDVDSLARAVHRLGPQVVVVTGGHRERAIDVFFDGRTLVEIPGERYADGAAHGSGCTHSSVLAARLAWGDTPLAAARIAKRRASEAVRDGLAGVGAGAGPVDVLGVT